MTSGAAANTAVKPEEKHGEKVEQKAPEKRRALGRGLESLLPGPRVVHSSAAPVPSTVNSPPFAKDAQDGAPTAIAEGSRAQVPAPHDPLPHTETISISAEAQTQIPTNLVVNIPVNLIEKNPYQTRYIFEEDALRDLAYSIKETGVVQPIVVRPAEEQGRYVLVLGERRLRASKMAGMETVPAMVKRVSELEAAEMTVVENMQREDLNCMEQAEAFRVLSRDFGLTQTDIAKRVGISRESVSNYMRLLKLPAGVQEYLVQGGLGFGEAKVLLQIEDPEKLEKLADKAYEKKWSAEQLSDEVMRMEYDLNPGSETEQKKLKGGARWIDPNVRAAQVELQELLGLRVRIKDRKGKGRIVIEYATVDDYDRVVGMLRGK